MSRSLSKILAVCALVAIIPLMIAGTALACYYSISATMIIEVYKNAVSPSSEADAQVAYKGKQDTSFEITTGHKKSITLQAMGQGYDFEGWYQGTTDEYKTAVAIGNVEFVSDKVEETFAMADQENLVAVFTLIDYTAVSYEYIVDPAAQTISTKVPVSGAADADYVYGDALPTLAQPDGWRFMGWKVKGSTDTTVYTEAAFAERENVVLEAVWEQVDPITLTYTLEDGTTYQTITNAYPGKAHTLLALPAAAAGYTNAWTVNGLEVSGEISPEDDTTIVLASTAINYKAVVAQNADIEYVAVDKASFTVVNVEQLENLFKTENYDVKYSFQNVKTSAGAVVVTFNSTEYTTAAALKDAIVAANPTGAASEIEVSVAVESAVTTVSTTDKQYWADMADVYYATSAIIAGNELNEYLGSNPVSKALSASVLELLEINESNGTMVALKDEDGNAVVLESVSVNGELITYRAGMTVADLMDRYFALSGETPSATMTVELVAFFVAE